MFYGLLVPYRSRKSEIETPRRSGGMALRVAYLSLRRYLNLDAEPGLCYSGNTRSPDDLPCWLGYR